MDQQAQALYLAAGLLVVVAALAMLVFITLRTKRRADEPEPPPAVGRQQAGAAGAARGGRGRGVGRLQAGVRRRRAAAAAAAAAVQAQPPSDAGSSDGDNDEEAGVDAAGGRRAHAREARRDGREAERAARSARDAKREAYDERRQAKDAEREAREAAEEAAAAEREAARQAADDAEAAKWMGQISLDEAGDAGADAAANGPGMLQAFVNYIVESKTVALEDLAAEFGLRPQEAIERVRALEAEGRLTGVMDDRGKFIYISREEMAAVAEFITRRGRVAIAELAAQSAQLIDLNLRIAPAPAAGGSERQLLLDDLAGDAPAVAVEG
ncbi:hypothetical protein WJX81_005800 [Elliptochloris bilobata]|uniref:DDRGK domain-containing protein 1 n=1 Tax=Elliptochloris bilobata TaxID=381761 RepID=A0AAW1R1P2_9CHLO